MLHTYYNSCWNLSPVFWRRDFYEIKCTPWAVYKKTLFWCADRFDIISLFRWHVVKAVSSYVFVHYERSRPQENIFRVFANSRINNIEFRSYLGNWVEGFLWCTIFCQFKRFGPFVISPGASGDFRFEFGSQERDDVLVYLICKGDFGIKFNEWMDKNILDCKK